MNKSAEAFRTIGEVAEELEVPKHVLRFWEGKFPQIRPMKRGGGRRYYRPEDMELLRGIRRLLHAEGYTIKGVQKILREQGIDQVKTLARESVDAARQVRNSATKGRPRSGAGTAGAAAAGRGVQHRSTSQREAAAAQTQDGADLAAAETMRRDAAVAAIIRELEQCRALLAAALPAALVPAVKGARAGGRA